MVELVKAIAVSKKVLVCDWLETYAGAERCVQSFTDIWDDFEVFSLVDHLKFDDRQKILKDKFALCRSKSVV